MEPPIATKGCGWLSRGKALCDGGRPAPTMTMFQAFKKCGIVGEETGGGGGDAVGKHEIHSDRDTSPTIEKAKRKKNIYSTDPIPLDNPWTFWVDRTERGSNMEEYEANLKRIYMVYTIYRFWAVYFNIPKPCDLLPRSSLHMMRDDRKPIWEEEYNCKGGTFRIRVQKRDSAKVWKQLLMAAIGEQLNEFVHEKDEICGVSISVREKEDVLLIWNRDAELAKESKIMECLHLILPDTSFLSSFYKPHVTHLAFQRSSSKGPLPTTVKKSFKIPVFPVLPENAATGDH